MKKISTLFITVCLFAVSTLKAQVNKQDSLILVELYDSTNGLNGTNWLSKAPVSSWYGIGVNSNNRVDSINLKVYLSGGSIPISIGNLINLKYLNLSSNNLVGSIPPSISNLTNLTYLDLTDNNLTGNIPSSLGNLTNLNYLDLHFNNLTGSIPSSLGNLSKLTVLNLVVNNLTGSIPSSLGNLINLQTLYLNLNQLSDTIPSSLGNLTNVTDLELVGNNLTGNIPVSFGNLTNLAYLELYNNQLSGVIPASLGNLTNLIDLQLWNNKLTGSIPSSLGNLTNLNQLFLNDNQLSGAIPPSLGSLTSLTNLKLYSNQLTDTIPSSLGNIPNLHYLYLDSNKLSGSFPPSFGNLTKIYFLYLYNNQLTGSIPSSLGNLPKLNLLNLSYNQLSGTVPSTLGSQAQLLSLSINNNQLTFNGMEALARKSVSYYSPQAIVPLTLKKSDTTFSVAVGGTPANNTYKWFNSGTLVTTIKSDSTYRPTSNGLYYVAATNAIATKLTLYSDSIIINYPTNPQDSLALVALYNSTGGANWVNHTNWLTKLPVSSWYGVTEYNWRVTGISLAANNLKGAIPASLDSLPYLSSLVLNNNQLTFSGIENIAKKFSFATYAHQAIVPLLQNGNSLSVSVGGTPANNSFKWYRNDTLVATKVADSTYTVTANGKYWVAATNAVATKLTLYSDTINITTLPIKDITLSAKETNGQVQLQWQTMGEINAASFVIQRSIDGVNFIDVNAKTAVGSGANGYSYIDASAASGVNYYRIKSIDKTGVIAYSKIVSLTTNHLSLTTFPNPAKDVLTIGGIGVGKSYNAIIISVLGKQVSTSVVVGGNGTGINVKNLTAGVYLLELVGKDGDRQTTRFVKE